MMNSILNNDFEMKPTQDAIVEVEKCDTCSKDISQMETRYHFSIQYYVHEGDQCEASVDYSVCSFECYMQLLKFSAQVLDNQNAKIDGMKMPFVKKVLDFYDS